MTLALGDPAPSFELKGVDGRLHTLDDYTQAPVLVLIQACNHCPYVMASQDLFKETQERYASRGVRLVVINSNDAELQPEDSFEAMVERAREERFNFDYLHDADQSYARTLGATRTPEVFVFDRDRRLVYHGAPESAVLDHRSSTSEDGEEQGLRRYLHDAIDAALDGSSPEITETPLVGCSVKSDDLILHRDPIRFEWRDTSAV